MMWVVCDVMMGVRYRCCCVRRQVRFVIGERLKQVLDLEPSTLIEYKHHEVAMQDMSTFRCGSMMLPSCHATTLSRLSLCLRLTCSFYLYTCGRQPDSAHFSAHAAMG